MHDLEKYVSRAAAHPVEFIVFIALSTPLAILTLATLHRNKNNQVFWCVAGLILVELLFRNGDDLQFHANRVVGLADEFSKGNFTGLLFNPQTGQAFPLFIYFSFLPYLIPVCLFFGGVPAYFCIKIALALYFLIFCAGMQILLSKAMWNGRNTGDANAAFLILSIFLCSTYVYGIWVLRDALGESAVYSLIPWIVMALFPEKSGRPLTLFFVVQLATHPLVFALSLVCEFALAYGVSEMPFMALARKILPPMAIALVLASPFWLPQILWLNLIIGNSVMPLPFSATFLGLPKMFSPVYRYTLGPWLPLAVGLLAVFAGKRLSGRAWLLIASFVFMLAVQTTYLRFFTSRVPGLSILQFVWRLMMPTAFVGLAALIAGLEPDRLRLTRFSAATQGVNQPLPLARIALRAKTALTSLFILTFANFVLFSLIYTPKYMGLDAYNQESYVRSLRFENLSGVGVFGPNYTRLPQDCSNLPGHQTEAISYRDLKDGAMPNQKFVSVENAPVGMVNYEMNGTKLAARACGRDLILGPIPPSSTITADEGTLRILMVFRGLSLMISFLLLAVTLAGASRRRKAAEA